MGSVVKAASTGGDLKPAMQGSDSLYVYYDVQIIMCIRDIRKC